jgi:hypothetical protein
MTTTTTLAALLAAAAFTLPLHAAAGPADLDGTWACRTPGVDHGTTPPILFLGAAQGSDTVIDVDGFARGVVGIGEVAADANGWWKIVPPQGPAFLARPETGRTARPAMQVRYNGADWRCFRVQPRAA